MQTKLILLVAALGVALACGAKADIWGHFETSGNHQIGTMDYVSVDFSIMGISHPRELVLGQSYLASYVATYTTTSDDPGFNVIDLFSGTGTVVEVNIDSDESWWIEIQFPQNPLPGAWVPYDTRIHFEQLTYTGLIAGWSAAPYGFPNEGPLEYQTVPNGMGVISSFTRNGEIVWTAQGGTVCSVEWASTLTSSVWKSSWEDLEEIRTAQGIMIARVPMFYRVVCQSNGYLQPMRVGTEWTYAASNNFGETWTLTETTCGTLSFPDPSLMPGCARKYYAVRRAETWEYYAPEGVGFLWNEAPYSYVRSTTNSVFEWQETSERRALQEAEPGAVWTNQFSHFKDLGEISIVCSNAGTEVVTVPAGTFECTRCESTVVGIPEMTCTDWISHDLGLVKRVSAMPNLIGGSSPVTYELESIKR